MVGAINKRDLLAHPIVTIRNFGWRTFWRALIARPGTPFLTVLADAGVLHSVADEVTEFVARCVELELQVSRIYTVLAKRFADEPAAAAFFAELAQQEESHAELLELCRAAAAQHHWDSAPVEPWKHVVPQLERRMREIEISVDGTTSLLEALELVIAIESSEINDLFNCVVSATDSDFVRRVRVFREAEARHLDFICEGISRLTPDLASQCRALRARCA